MTTTPEMAEPLLDRLLSRAVPKKRNEMNATSAISAINSAYSTRDAPASASLEI